MPPTDEYKKLMGIEDTPRATWAGALRAFLALGLTGLTMMLAIAILTVPAVMLANAIWNLGRWAW
jgi:hypothetical protein